MEFTFSQLKQKDVISLIDGKNLGKVCDLTFTFPENNLIGFTVTGCKGFKLVKQEQFIPMRAVVKIGDDAVLVKPEKPEKPEIPSDCPPKKKEPHPPNCPPPCPPNRRSYDEYE